MFKIYKPVIYFGAVLGGGGGGSTVVQSAPTVQAPKAATLSLNTAADPANLDPNSALRKTKQRATAGLLGGDSNAPTLLGS
jgi:hypothetical protein